MGKHCYNNWCAFCIDLYMYTQCILVVEFVLTCRQSVDNNELPYVKPFVHVCKKLGTVMGV